MPQKVIPLADPMRLQALLEEAEHELEKIQPRIEELEKYIDELRELKTVKQRLLTLKMSLMTLIDSNTKDNVMSDSLASMSENCPQTETKLLTFDVLSTSKTFHPEAAFQAADQILKQKSSLNYEMFRAVVFNGGKATTDQIKAYLVEIGARQPQTGDGFDNVPLTEISSRTNYLVRKGILQPMGRGQFYTTVGWVDPVSE